MFCKKCGKEINGKFCEFCGESSIGNTDLKKSVAGFISGVVILSVGFVSFAAGFFTMISDLSLINLLLKGYDYIGPLSVHEIIMVFFTFVGFWCIYAGIIMVSTNKAEAACAKKSYKIIANISYAAVAVLFVCAFIVAIPHYQKGGYFGVSYHDFF